MTSASTMVETTSKSSAWCVHQMAIYRVCNIFLFFFNSPSELTFWITPVSLRMSYEHVQSMFYKRANYYMLKYVFLLWVYLRG
jgi:hypothetical protein